MFEFDFDYLWPYKLPWYEVIYLGIAKNPTRKKCPFKFLLMGRPFFKCKLFLFKHKCTLKMDLQGDLMKNLNLL